MSAKRGLECSIITPDGPIFDPELVPDHDPSWIGYDSRLLMGELGFTKEQIFMVHPPKPGDPDHDEFESLRHQSTMK